MSEDRVPGIPVLFHWFLLSGDFTTLRHLITGSRNRYQPTVYVLYVRVRACVGCPHYLSHFLQTDHPAHRHTSPEDTPPSISPHIDKIQATWHTGCPQYMDLVTLNIHREFTAAKMASFVEATRHGSCLCKAR